MVTKRKRMSQSFSATEVRLMVDLLKVTLRGGSMQLGAPGAAIAGALLRKLDRPLG